MSTEQPQFPPVPPDSPSPAVPAPTMPPAQPAASTGPASSMLAVTSFIAGLLTWFSLPLMFLVVPTPLCVIVAIVCGHMARGEIRRNPSLQGNGLALTGLILGWAMVAAFVLAVVAFVIFGAAILSAIGLSSQFN